MSINPSSSLNVYYVVAERTSKMLKPTFFFKGVLYMIFAFVNVAKDVSFLS